VPRYLALAFLVAAPTIATAPVIRVSPMTLPKAITAPDLPMATPDQLRRIMPDLSPDDAVVWAAKLADACKRYGVDNPLREAMFLAHVAQESAGLTKFEEGLDYSAERLTKVWRKRYPTLAAAAPYAHNPQALANKTYSNRMGNGNVASGDGYRFRGRGPIQLTGRGLYAECGKAIGFDLVANPDLLLEIGVGSRSAAWYFQSRGCIRKADARDVRGATYAINGGYNGVEEREAYYERAKAVLGVR